MAMRELKRKKAHREWMIRNLTTSVILYERVVTTVAKAKEVRRWVDRAITQGKKDDLATRRRLLAWFPDTNAPKKIWEVLRSRYTDRNSGYTRLVRLGRRVGDSAETMLIELIPAVDKDLPVQTANEPAVKATKTSTGKTQVTVRRKGATK